MDEQLVKYLNEIGVKYKEHKHKAVFSVEESKFLKKDIPGLHCKTLFLKDENGKFYLVAMSVDKRLNSKLFRVSQNIKDVRFGSEDEMKKEVKLTPGSVSIFGAIYIKDKKVKLVIDREVWDSDMVGFHPNINTATLEITHKELQKYYDSLNCEKEIAEL